MKFDQRSKGVGIALLLGLFLRLGSFNISAQTQPGTLLWNCPVPGIISESCPAIAPDGTIYVGGTGLTAVRPDGSIKWTAPVNWNVVGSPAVADDGTIYCSDRSFTLYAFNPDGTQKWSYDLQAQFYYAIEYVGSPAIGVDGSLYCVAGGVLFAFTPDGVPKWPLAVDEGYSSISPVIGADGTIYAGGYSGGSYGLSAINPNGSVKWRYAPSGYGGESPAIGLDGTIYFNASIVQALRPDGSLVWASSFGSSTGSPVLGADGTVYFGAGGQLFSVTSSGAPAWNGTIGLNPWHWGSATVPAVDAGGTVYFYSSNSIFAVSQSGEVQWIYSGMLAPLRPLVIFTGIPIIGPDGTIYASFGEGLSAIQGSGHTLGTTGWPVFQQNLRHTGKIEHPALHPLVRRPDANFDLEFTGEVGQPYTIQNTTDFLNWNYLTNVVATTRITTVADLTATNAPARFYRVTSP